MLAPTADGQTARPQETASPLVRVSLREDKSPQLHKTLMDQVYLALHSAMGTPENDRFAVIHEHSESCYNNSGDFLGINRSSDHMILQITVLAGRSVDQKRAHYAAIAQNLGDTLGVRKEDIFINLLEVAREDFSLGNGIAQFA